jgi:predicted 3-demethylubiquinone-9 3-methyltransferase (glyoxalase superfamily)
MQKIVADVPGGMLCDPDAVKAGRAMQAMMQMVKLDIALLEQAYRSG